MKRSAAVALAVTFQKLSLGRYTAFSEDEQLVLSALRRSKTELNNASEAELGAYIRSLNEGQLKGVVANVKGIYFEMLLAQAENLDGDEFNANLFATTNNPGADLEYTVNGDVIRIVQVKAVQDPASIVEHFARYPEIDVIATSEVCSALGDTFAGRLSDGGRLNSDLDSETRDALDALPGDTLADIAKDGVAGSVLVAGALQARAIFQGRRVTQDDLRNALESAGVGIATTVVLEALLGAI